MNTLTNSELDTVIARLCALREGRLLLYAMNSAWIPAEVKHVVGYPVEVVANCDWLRIEPAQQSQAHPAPTPHEQIVPWTLATVPNPFPQVFYEGRLTEIRECDEKGVCLLNGWELTWSALLRDCKQRNGEPCGVKA